MTRREKSRLSPIDGTVLEIAAERGEHIGSGTVVVTLADTTQLQLTVDVAETDIVQVAVGQAVEVEIDALSGQTFAGVVSDIAPGSDDDSSVVSYAVTIRITDDSLDRVLPGMTAVATLSSGDAAALDDQWLVPTDAIRQQGDSAVVLVVRDEGTVPVTVVPGTVQAEWTTVQSSELSVGDEVMGSVTSYATEDTAGGPPGGAAGGMPPAGP